MAIRSLNPATGKLNKEFTELSDSEISAKITTADKQFSSWKNTEISDRTELLAKLGEVLAKNKEQYVKFMSIEMGKTVMEGRSEIDKCIMGVKYYAEHIAEMIAPQEVATEFTKSYIRFDPLGVLLAVMPWNFPFWQVLRFAVPVISAGNVVLLKHASNVPQCALAIEQAFTEAGYPEGVFQTLLIGSSKVEQVVADPRVQGGSLTGSSYAGAQFAGNAAKHLKKTLLELGGSDPFIVNSDADITKAALAAASSRLRNVGQSCNSAKRFLVHKDIAAQFVKEFKEVFAKQIVGDPMSDATNLGSMVSAEATAEVQNQFAKSVEMGAKVEFQAELKLGNELDAKAFCAPAILTNVTADMPVWNEEVFGPVAPVMQFSTIEEAIKIANDSEYGLGASVWMADTTMAEEVAKQLNTGNVFINKMVSSDPRLPFGGIKNSGYGRELGDFVVKEFVNIKTVVVV